MLVNNVYVARKQNQSNQPELVSIVTTDDLTETLWKEIITILRANILSTVVLCSKSDHSSYSQV